MHEQDGGRGAVLYRTSAILCSFLVFPPQRFLGYVRQGQANTSGGIDGVIAGGRDRVEGQLRRAQVGEINGRMDGPYSLAGPVEVVDDAAA